ncbi:Methyltransferase type 11 [Desulfofarcimen acetoxidans DSM 771]|uniref:Methyltransferase type 11 n=1 Tax=Desulfofarcimen acetoxidans (strain ATCC 49208 / DSM 771 / KCTC 5769 / VKM B-1644 / 5575) TaxID=485916 RepID=C8W6C7_DESAS|nr:class I SAM-dependent methyltransferase [Desulfofarcimen acetoxidans]ACV62216.1 Methyltransferase type 11 [Desulfofarcimen acetoxidans DSM 771]
MTQYHELAGIYDYLVQGVDFEGWIDYIEELLVKFEYSPKTIIDLACGTGNTAFPFARRGYRVAGVDLSARMIDIARKKAEKENLNINFFVQDICCLKLPEPVELITCFHDGLNYLLNYEDIKLTFKKVFDNLLSGGLFIFDLNAVRWLADSSQETTVVQEDDLTLIWQTSYEPEKDIWTIDLTGFFREGDLYRKFQERHSEKAYTPQEIETALREAGLELLAAYHAFSIETIKYDSRRHFYVAKKMA